MIDWDKPNPAADMAPGYAGPPATFEETVAAARKQYDAARNFVAPNIYAGRVGKQVVDALRTRGRTGFTGADGRKVAYGDDSLRSDYVLNPTVAPRIWADVAAEQARDPAFLKGMGTPDEFEAALLVQRRKDYDEAGEVLGRAEGLTGLGGELAGGLIGSMTDPIQLTALAATAALPAGRLGLGVIEKLFGGKLALGTATKIASEALGNAAVNVVAVVPTLPVTMERSAEIGVEMTGRDVAMELAGAAVAGGVMGAAVPTLGAAGRSVRRMVRDLRGLDRPLTPAEIDALPVLEQAAADIAASPFKPTPEGDAAHAERLTEAVTALENDRPVDPAVFEKPTPDVKEAAVPGFDPSPYLDAAAAYARDRKAGPLTTEALGEALGISRGQAQDVLSRLASGGKGRGLFRVSYNPKSGVAKFTRPMQRRGFVDLITQLADMGGVRPDGGHDLINALGQRFVGGAGPLFRKSGMTLNEVGEFLMQNGWVRAGETGNGIPTEAEVIDLIDSALRAKMYHPEEGAAAMEADRMAVQANDTQGDELRGQVAEAMGAFNARAAEDGYKPITLTDEDVATILPTIGDHATVEDAIFAHWDTLGREAEMEAAAVGDDMGFDDYADDVPFDGGDDGFGQAGQDSGGSAPASGDAGQGGAGSGGAEVEAFTNAAAEQTLELFDTPQGEGPKAQVESLHHDLKAEDAAYAARAEARRAAEREFIAAAPNDKEGRRPNDAGVYVDGREEIVMPSKTRSTSAKIKLVQLETGEWISAKDYDADMSGGGGPTSVHSNRHLTRAAAILEQAREFVRNFDTAAERGNLKKGGEQIRTWAQRLIADQQIADAKELASVADAALTAKADELRADLAYYEKVKADAEAAKPTAASARDADNLDHQIRFGSWKADRMKAELKPINVEIEKRGLSTAKEGTAIPAIDAPAAEAGAPQRPAHDLLRKMQADADGKTGTITEGGATATLTVNQAGDSVELSGITSTVPGDGTKLMQAIIDKADANGVALHLYAKGYAETPTSKLVEWYKRFGFTQADPDQVPSTEAFAGDDVDGIDMEREPSATAPSADVKPQGASTGFKIGDRVNATDWRGITREGTIVQLRPGARGTTTFDVEIDGGAGNFTKKDLQKIEAPAAPVGDTATGSLGLDAAQAAPEGGMTERQRAEMQARLQQSQMRRGGQQAADQISGGLFDAARDQLDAFDFAMPDGSSAKPADLLAEFDADDAALKTIKDCL